MHTLSHMQITRDFSLKKAFEVAYALSRISKELGEKILLGRKLEDAGLRLLESVVREDYFESQREEKLIEYLLRIGADSGVITHHNMELIVEATNALNSAISNHVDSAKLPDISIEDIFSSNSFESKKEEQQANIFEESRKDEDVQFLTRDEPNESIAESFVSVDRVVKLEDSNPAKEEVFGNSVRQSIIIDKIRQKGECRLRDVQELLPNLSERTIRYELQSLVERGLIERIGTSGPGTYYRIGIRQFA